MRPTFVPAATYRFQFNKNFTFNHARRLLYFMEDLGVGAYYASPIFKARPGSEHGYDVVDPQSLNPELGSEPTFYRFAKSLKRHKMGLVLDVVPNHMCVTESANPWWNDVLENGPSSPYAICFDIDWRPPKIELANKILLPELGEQYGRELENQSITVAYEENGFQAHYYSNRYPIAPRSWALILDMILGHVKGQLREDEPALLELESIRTAVKYLPLRTETDPEKVRERYREKEVIAKRLSQLVRTAPAIHKALDAALIDLNGKKGEPRSFDRLEFLLEDQVYRLCYWKVATDEINYRRFFDQNHLAAVRVEEPEVFNKVHGLPLKLIEQGLVTGLRIDHVDGLFDPGRYLSDLQEKIRMGKPGSNDFYIVVEKILTRRERLRRDWKIQGTTGYDFLNLVNGLLVDSSNKRKFLDLYSNFTGLWRSTTDVSATCKKLIMHVSMASELQVLSSQLDRISEQHRWSRDFTFESLRFALREVIAYFPAYRGYTSPGQTEISTEDRQLVTIAIQKAKRNNPATSESIFDFIQDVLLLKDPEGLTESQIAERRTFIFHLQQLTGPVMAKGLEDTAFYRYFPLASLNEVGGDLDNFGDSVDSFHRENIERLATWPHTLLATMTHDTKRSEDVRARISVLSEIPTEWNNAILRWQALNQSKKISVNGYATPDANEEYLLYQTLVGMWPLEPMDSPAHQQFVERIERYMIKAIKEAKIHTSWVNPNVEYESAMSKFVQSILETIPENTFIDDLVSFHRPIARAGLLNSLAQLVLKMTSPGVPDFYQGTELWNFSLVDPDNRQPVNYKHIVSVFEQVRKEVKSDVVAAVRRMSESPADGRIKVHVMNGTLNFRKRERLLFEEGTYEPLVVNGPFREHVCAFLRRQGQKMAITIVTRFHMTQKSWKETTIALPVDLQSLKFKNILSGETVEPTGAPNELRLPLESLLGPLPVAILERIVEEI